MLLANCFRDIGVYLLERILHLLQLGVGKKYKDLMGKTDLHIHFPAGAVSKDGPSAGVTITTVLVSLFTERCVRSDTAMTGEITLRGLVLPVSVTIATSCSLGIDFKCCEPVDIVFVFFLQIKGSFCSHHFLWLPRVRYVCVNTS